MEEEIYEFIARVYNWKGPASISNTRPFFEEEGVADWDKVHVRESVLARWPKLSKKMSDNPPFATPMEIEKKETATIQFVTKGGSIIQLYLVNIINAKRPSKKTL